MPHRHEIRVRYGEVDLQGVVFNAHYFAYVDDAMDTWLRTVDRAFERHGWDLMLKRVELLWHDAAGLGDTLVIDVAVQRWGNTSFEVRFDGTVGGRDVFTANVTYVGVRSGTQEPLAPPPAIRSLLGDEPPAP